MIFLIGGLHLKTVEIEISTITYDAICYGRRRPHWTSGVVGLLRKLMVKNKQRFWKLKDVSKPLIVMQKLKLSLQKRQKQLIS